MRAFLSVSALLSLVIGCDIAACPRGSVVDSMGACVPIVDGGAGDACVEMRRFWMDLDGDGVGSGRPFEACNAPEAAVIDGDCAPEDATRYAGAIEVCDTIDQDCDGAADEGTRSTFYADGDRDGEGDPASAVLACVAPDNYLTTATDCDDTCETCSSHGVETCDGYDNDCDGAIDEEVLVRFYPDCDADGFAVAGAAFMEACTSPALGDACGAGFRARWTSTAPGPGTTDCNDLEALASPTSSHESASSYVGATGAPSWDWNCDGVETRSITATSGPTTCTERRVPPITLCDATGSYWVSGAVPACGESQTLNGCTLGSPCGQLRFTSAQTCR